MASQSIINSVNNTEIVFTHRRDVAANSPEGFGSRTGAKGPGHFLFDLYHANIAFSQVVVKGNTKVIHKGQGLSLAFIEWLSNCGRLRC